MNDLSWFNFMSLQSSIGVQNSPCKAAIPLSCIKSSSGIEKITFHYLELDNRHNIDYNLRQGCQKRITMCHKNC